MKYSLLRIALLGWVLCTVGVLRAQILVSGPIMGACDRHSAKVWFMVEECGAVWVEGEGNKYSYGGEGRRCWHDKVRVTVEVTDLERGQEYRAQVWMDGKAIGDPFMIHTAPDKVQETWSFMVGSCVL